MSYEGKWPSFYPFDKISAAEFAFKQFSQSFDVLFCHFSFISTCLMVSASSISKYL